MDYKLGITFCQYSAAVCKKLFGIKQNIGGENPLDIIFRGLEKHFLRMF